MVKIGFLFKNALKTIWNLNSRWHVGILENENANSLASLTKNIFASGLSLQPYSDLIPF